MLRRRSWLTLVLAVLLSLVFFTRILLWWQSNLGPNSTTDNNAGDPANMAVRNANGDQLYSAANNNNATASSKRTKELKDPTKFTKNGKINWDVWGFARDVSIVYTWVNGSDPKYRELRAQYGGTKAVGGSRDRDSGELMHSLRSLERYMSWNQGTIYIVSPNQVPSWIKKDHPRLKFIDQDSLFPDPSVLPVFSSNPIEQNLWRIPGLTERFIHMNDDYFFGKPVMPWHFFTKDRGVRLFFEGSVVRGGTKEHNDLKKQRKKLWLASVYNTVGLFEDQYGHRVRNFIKHAPFVYHRDALEMIQEKWKKEFDLTLQHKFRNYDDVLVPFAHHNFLIEEGAKCCEFNFEIAPVKEMQQDAAFVLIKDDEKDLQEKFKNVRKNRPRFFAMNDSFTKSATAETLFNFLEELYPFPSSFEAVQ